MAKLVCWSSGLLEIYPTKEAPEGTVIISSGLRRHLEVDMRTHGQYIDLLKNWYVPGCQDIPAEGREEAAVQHERMTLVIEWTKKLCSAKVKP